MDHRKIQEKFTLRLTLVLLILFGTTLSVQCQDLKPFESFKDDVRRTWAKGNQSSAIKLLQSKKDQYTTNYEQHTILYYLGLLFLETEEYERSFAIFKEGFTHGFFFSFWPQHLTKINKHPNGTNILRQNETLKIEFETASEIKYELIFPKEYDPNRSYPLLYFLHGKNSSLDYLKRQWAPMQLSKEFIVALLQSPSPTSNFTFDWTANVSDITLLQRIHLKISEDHPIDNSKVILSGFSNGARTALEWYFDQTIPVVGFIAFSPSKSAVIDGANNLKIPEGRGVLITGEKDYMLSSQVATANTLLSQSFPLRLVVLPDHGHDYPSHFQKEMNSSINFILEVNDE